MSWRLAARLSVLLLAGLWAPRVAAQAAADEVASPPSEEAEGQAAADVSQAEESRLGRYLHALEARRLLTVEAASAEELADRVRRGEDALFDGRADEAVRWLFEVVESPRFADFTEEEAYQAAEWWLATALRELGAMRSAERYTLRVLARGVDARYFGPAFRTWTDVALEGGDPQGALQRLLDAGLDLEDLPDDATAELAYLRGRIAFDAGQLEQAVEAFEQVGPRSRFHAQARFLTGVVHVRRGQLGEAEGAFCAAAQPNEGHALFADERLLRVRDRSWLALGRIAHEQGRAEDAFYYYFQVPQDSERVAEALFEAAFAMYEGEDYETALDLLDQLRARFPRTAAADEAALLRGYLYLGSCRFEEADELFQAYRSRFEPVLELTERWLADPAGRERLVERLLTLERTRQKGGAPAAGEQDEALSTLLAMLRVHPGFYRLHRAIATLDAEAARAGRASTELAALSARMHGSDAPRAVDEPSSDWVSESETLRRRILDGKATLRALGEQLQALRAAGAAAERIAPVQQKLSALGQRLARLEQRLGEMAGEPAADASGEAQAEGDDALEALLAEDVARAAQLPRRVAALRARLVQGAERLLEEALGELRDRLARGLRRARIGRIDAVMGSKRRIERQIESLAAGRYPPELVDPLRARGLLRDDEEYWPFEGEYWEDEFVEHEAAEEAAP